MRHNGPLNVTPGFLWKYSEIEQQCCKKETSVLTCAIVYQLGRAAAISCQFCGIGNKNFGPKLPFWCPFMVHCPKLYGAHRTVIWFSGS